MSETDDNSDEAAMAKMSLQVCVCVCVCARAHADGWLIDGENEQELWAFLSDGADKLKDPTLDERPPLTDADCDIIIEQGRMQGTGVKKQHPCIVFTHTHTHMYMHTPHTHTHTYTDADDEAALEIAGAEGGEGLDWHEEREAVMQELEEEEELSQAGLVGVGRGVRSVLQKAKRKNLKSPQYSDFI